jgi:hypothetical protein
MSFDPRSEISLTFHFIDFVARLLMKQPVRFFLSYAHCDRADVERLRSVLAPILKTSSGFEFGEWIDQQIPPGEHWRAEIEQALGRSRFGLLLLSPGFLASEFIRRLPPHSFRPLRLC